MGKKKRRRTYDVHWHMRLVGTMPVLASTPEEALELAEWELHHNPNFLTEQPFEKEADITEVVEARCGNLALTS